MEDPRNEAVAEYEDHLRDAERSIEKALQAICPYGGEDINEARLNVECKVLAGIQDAIRATWKLYV